MAHSRRVATFVKGEMYWGKLYLSWALKNQQD